MGQFRPPSRSAARLLCIVFFVFLVLHLDGRAFYQPPVTAHRHPKIAKLCPVGTTYGWADSVLIFDNPPKPQVFFPVSISAESYWCEIVHILRQLRHLGKGFAWWNDLGNKSSSHLYNFGRWTLYSTIAYYHVSLNQQQFGWSSPIVSKIEATCRRHPLGVNRCTDPILSFAKLQKHPRPIFAGHDVDTSLGGVGRSMSLYGLPPDHTKSQESDDDEPPFGPFDGCVPMWRVVIGAVGCVTGILLFIGSGSYRRFILGMTIFVISSLIWLTGHMKCNQNSNGYSKESRQHNSQNYTAITPLGIRCL